MNCAKSGSSISPVVASPACFGGVVSPVEERLLEDPFWELDQESFRLEDELWSDELLFREIDDPSEGIFFADVSEPLFLEEDLLNGEVLRAEKVDFLSDQMGVTGGGVFMGKVVRPRRGGSAMHAQQNT